MLKLIEMTTEKIIFEMNTLKARTFIMLQAQESLLQSPKAYYDYFKDLIGTAYYNERTLVSSFMYRDLEVSARESAKTCIQVPSASCYDFENIAYQYIEYPSGTYLCVYYTYTPGDQVGLGALKKVINQYLKDKGLEIDMERLLEFEHPELSMLLAYNCELYEIQIKVR